MKMNSANINTTKKCGGTCATFSVAEMPHTEQETSFMDGVGPVSTNICSSNIAPIFSFDEDGDILPMKSPFTPNNSVDIEYISVLESDNAVIEKGQRENDKEKLDDREKDVQLIHKCSTGGDSLATKKKLLGRLRKMTKSDSSNSVEGQTPETPTSKNSLTSGVDTSSEVHTSSGVNITSKHNVTSEVNATSEVSIVVEQPCVPKIDFHAPSIEVVDDYLEGHLEEDSKLKDLCASLFGDAGFAGHQMGSAKSSCVSLLTAAPQETAPKRQKVPFSTVVFTERKPSTGDALIQSLGLSGDTADTIQDIASKNQGAARERLQLAEGGQCDVPGLTNHCESCGISPEECLKKLGLHSDRERFSQNSIDMEDKTE